MQGTDKELVVMYQDEAGFGRISKTKACWTPRRERPIVPSHHIREYLYAYGAVSPQTGDHFFLVLPYSNTQCMNIFLEQLSQAYSNQQIILICDNASWHRSNELVIPDNIIILHIPPYTPEMNSSELVWRELRKPFANRVFSTLEKVVDHLCDAICALSNELIYSIVHRDWLVT